jgi:hypothetical protein
MPATLPRMRRLTATVTLLVFALGGAASAVARPAALIIGGNPATGSFPFMAAIVHSSAPSTFLGQYCGGTLVAASWILTAGHCVEDEQRHLYPPTAIRVMVGRSDLDSVPIESLAVVRRVVRNPRFLELPDGTVENDVALLELPQPASETPVALVGAGDEQRWAPGTLATIIGWGNVTTSGDNAPSALQQARVPILSDSTCNQYVAGFRVASMLCAGFLVHGGVDTCQGDSGGPLLVRDEHGGWVEAGLTSGGVGCAQPYNPGVYARLATLRCFVRDYATPGLPEAPSVLAARQAVNQLLVEISAACPAGSPVTAVTITINPIGRVVILPANARHVLISGLPRFQRFTLTITATNASGASAPLTSPLRPYLGTPLRNATRPMILGAPRVGRVVRCAKGSWIGSRPVSYVTRFFVYGHRRAIASAVRLAARDAGTVIACQVTAVSATGEVAAVMSRPVRIRVA